uniref:Eukaryotic translation initiation factor 3 subunit K n=1 Tax=Sciurus vulgaris TaxID=55149 RepID=A0A8D2DXI9_SCIVU
MAMFEQMRANVGKLLKGIDRYNPENLATLERYVETQAKENAYDLEANLAVLKLYQFNPAFFQTTVTAQILLKALTNLPHTDFTLCKCMIDQAHQEERPIRQILYLGDLLETCHFQAFWQALDENMDLLEGITGFEDSVRKCKSWALYRAGWGVAPGPEAALATILSHVHSYLPCRRHHVPAHRPLVTGRDARGSDRQSAEGVDEQIWLECR